MQARIQCAHVCTRYTPGLCNPTQPSPDIVASCWLVLLVTQPKNLVFKLDLVWSVTNSSPPASGGSPWDRWQLKSCQHEPRLFLLPTHKPAAIRCFALSSCPLCRIQLNAIIRGHEWRDVRHERVRGGINFSVSEHNTGASISLQMCICLFVFLFLEI